MTVVEENDPRLKFVKLDVATTPPPGLIEHLNERYWVHHPDKGILYWSPKDKKGRSMFDAPQCNSNEIVTKRMVEGMYPWAEIKFLPSVFRRIDPRDY